MLNYATLPIITTTFNERIFLTVSSVTKISIDEGKPRIVEQLIESVGKVISKFLSSSA